MQDHLKSPGVAIINEAFARREFGEPAAAIGRRIASVSGRGTETRGSRRRHSRRAIRVARPRRARAEMYRPLAQTFMFPMAFVVKTSGDPVQLAAPSGRRHSPSTQRFRSRSCSRSPPWSLARSAGHGCWRCCYRSLRRRPRARCRRRLRRRRLSRAATRTRIRHPPRAGRGTRFHRQKRVVVQGLAYAVGGLVTRPSSRLRADAADGVGRLRHHDARPTDIRCAARGHRHGDATGQSVAGAPCGACRSSHHDAQRVAPRPVLAWLCHGAVATENAACRPTVDS